MSRPAFPRRRLLLSSAIWMVTMLAASAAHAQDDAFKTGLNARGDRKWQDVVVQMRRAIQDDGTESTRMVRSGIGGLLRQGGTQYLPYFFLGEALFNTQDCAGAVAAWSRSEQQGAIRSRPIFWRLCRRVTPRAKRRAYFLRPSTTRCSPKRRCKSRTSTARQQRSSNLERRTSTSGRDAKGQYDRAYSEIQSARARLDTATKSRSPTDFGEASAAADRAKVTLAAIETSLNAAVYARQSVQAQARDVEQMIGTADEYDRAIDGRKSALTPSLTAARQEGQNAVTRARDRLSAGVKASSTSALSESRAFALEASNRLKQVLDELTRFEKDVLQRQFTDAAARAQEAFAFVDGAFATLDRLATQRPASVRPDMTAEREAVQRQVAAVRRRFEAARKAENVSAIADVTRQTSDAGNRLNALISTFGPMTITDRGVPSALAEGARLFFAGEYQQAVSVLNPEGGFATDTPLQLHVHLFRAAASYALFLRSREADRSLLERALTEVEACRQIDSGFQPDPRAFTPKFITFFREGSATGTKTAAPSPSQQ